MKIITRGNLYLNYGLSYIYNSLPEKEQLLLKQTILLEVSESWELSLIAHLKNGIDYPDVINKAPTILLTDSHLITDKKLSGCYVINPNNSVEEITNALIAYATSPLNMISLGETIKKSYTIDLLTLNERIVAREFIYFSSVALVAKRLNLSKKTIYTHMSNIGNKLGVSGYLPRVIHTIRQLLNYTITPIPAIFVKEMPSGVGNHPIFPDFI